jgi:hypothetical protein
LAIAGKRLKNPGRNRQQAEVELIFILLDECNFFHEKIVAIAKHYFFEIVIYFELAYRGSNWKIKA